MIQAPTAIQQGNNRKPCLGLNSGAKGTLGRGDGGDNMMEGQERPDTLCCTQEEGTDTPDGRAWEMLKGPEKSPQQCL